MQAVQFRAYGSPDVLEVVDAPTPVPDDGEIVIRVVAAGVNSFDSKVRQGFVQEQMPLEFPAGTGLEASGTVTAIGNGVEGTAIGDAVFGMGRGTAAEEAVLTAWAPIPAGVAPVDAAAWAVAAETSVRILDDLAPASGSTILVSGASGGVGTALVQIAVSRGLRVLGTASAGNQEYVGSLGATPLVYGEGLADRVADAAPEGIAAAFDLAGSGIVPELVAITGDADRVISIADFSAPRYGARVSGAGSESAAARAFAEVAGIDGFRVPVADTFALAETPAAQARSTELHTVGKLLIVL